MKSRFGGLFTAVAVVLVLLAVEVLLRIKQSPQKKLSDRATGATSATNFPTAAQAQNGRILSDAATNLSAAKSAEERNAALARLRQILAGGNTKEISSEIRRLLDSKLDAATGLGFKVGQHGVLTEAPTLRTLLLDRLAAIDPAGAVECARVILSESSSPDEWAVALRNLARGDASADARALLEEKMKELLQNQAWRQNPSAGYLEAFDTAVFLGGTTLLPPLTDLVRDAGDQGTAYAAFLTLDRLAFNEPAAILPVLEAHPGWMQGREQTRADYFARADVGDANQRSIVETYLLDPARTPSELDTFANVFPNANFLVSQNLLTVNGTLTGAALKQRDQVSLQVVNGWLADSRFSKIQQPLQKLQSRLEQFVKTEN